MTNGFWEIHDLNGCVLKSGLPDYWAALDWMDESGLDLYMEPAYIDNPIK